MPFGKDPGNVGEVCRHLSNWLYKYTYTVGLGLIPCLTPTL
jgi:hypothetical protein